MMRHQLRHGPVQLSGAADGQTVRCEMPGSQVLGDEQHLELESQRAALLIGRVEQMLHGRRIAGRARRLRSPERGERLRRDHPRRNSGGEVLREKRSERHILPGLDVARRPVIQQANPAMWSLARLIGIGLPGSFPGPIQTPSSSS